MHMCVQRSGIVPCHLSEGGESQTGGGEEVYGPAEETVRTYTHTVHTVHTHMENTLFMYHTHPPFGAVRMDRIKSRQKRFKRGKERMLTLVQESTETHQDPPRLQQEQGESQSCGAFNETQLNVSLA